MTHCKSINDSLKMRIKGRKGHLTGTKGALTLGIYLAIWGDWLVIKKQKGVRESFTGKWHITKMSEWDEEYCNMEVKAFINIERNGMGEFQFGLVTGSLNGDFKKTTDETIFDFTFDGMDECDPTNGDGWMKIKEDGTAEGEIRFHMGDSSKFWAKRAK